MSAPEPANGNGGGGHQCTCSSEAILEAWLRREMVRLNPNGVKCERCWWLSEKHLLDQRFDREPFGIYPRIAQRIGLSPGSKEDLDFVGDTLDMLWGLVLDLVERSTHTCTREVTS